MRKFFTLLLILISGITLAQINISYSDYQQAFQVGKAYKTYASEAGSPVSVFVGNASASSQVWNFTGFNVNHVGNIISVETGNTPFFFQFPTTTVSLYGKVFFPGQDTTENWQYQNLATDKLTLLGVSDQNSVLLEYNPPAIQALIPLTYGSTWVSERDSTYISQNTWLIRETTVIADAFGTMKFPSGDYDCLRLTFNYQNILHVPMGVDTSYTRGYHWYSRNLAEFHISDVLEEQFNQDTIDVYGFSYSLPAGTSSINEHMAESSVPLILPNYPNPFSQSTTIAFYLPDSGTVNMKISDWLGKGISIIVNEKMAAGHHEVEFNAAMIPSGLYFCQLQCGKNVTSRKILVTK